MTGLQDAAALMLALLLGLGAGGLAADARATRIQADPPSEQDAGLSLEADAPRDPVTPDAALQVRPSRELAPELPGADLPAPDGPDTPEPHRRAPDEKAPDEPPDRPDASAPAPADGPSSFDRRLARQYVATSDLLARQGDLAGAVAALERALGIDPGLGEAHVRLGVLLNRLEQFGEAERHFQRALALGVDSAGVHAGLAVVSERLGRDRSAARHGREALRRNPDLPDVANNLAWLLATSPDPEVRDPEEALELATVALRAAGPSPPFLDTLAAAYAASGRFEEAAETASRGAQLARRRGAAALAREIEERGALYQVGNAYTEE